MTLQEALERYTEAWRTLFRDLVDVLPDALRRYVRRNQ